MLDSHETNADDAVGDHGVLDCHGGRTVVQEGLGVGMWDDMRGTGVSQAKREENRWVEEAPTRCRDELVSIVVVI